MSNAKINIRERGFEYKGFRLGQEVILKNLWRTLNGEKVKIICFDTYDKNMYVGVEVDRGIGTRPTSFGSFATDLLRGSCRKAVHWCYLENIEVI